MERKGVDNHIIPSSSRSVLNQSMKCFTLVNLERRCLEIELAARDAENKKIREEILMKAEILKERELEDKIIRKFVLEGNIGAREILSLLGSRGSSVGADKKIPYLSSHQWKQTELVDYGALPFQREPRPTMMAIPTPVFNLCKDTLTHVVKPTVNVSPAAGIKRKFETENANGGEPSMSIKAQKQQLVEWSCNLCKVKTSCEDHLKAHLHGKKHLAKKRALKKVHANAPKKVALVPPPIPNAPTEPAQEIKVAPPQLPKVSLRPVVDEVPPPLANAQPVPALKIKVPPPRLPNASVGHVVDVAGMKRKFEFVKETGSVMQAEKKQVLDWSCTLCGVKATGEEQLKAHLIGKKHKTKERASRRVQNKLISTRLNMEQTHPPSTNVSAREEANEQYSCTLCNFAAKDEDEMDSHKVSDEHLRRFMENGGALTQIEPMFE